MKFPANQKPCPLFSWCSLDWLSTLIFGWSYCYLTTLRPWIILRQVLSQFFFFFGDQTPELNPKIIPRPLQLLSPPCTQRYLWRLNYITVMKFAYMNPQQPHTKGLLKCAAYGLKYYEWATRENYTIVILPRTRRLCHLIMKRNPAHHGYRPRP